MAAVEDKHFWFSARAKLIKRSLSRRLGGLRGQSVLDIGCGTGFVLAALEKSGMIGAGCDMHQSWLEHARRRVKGDLIQVDATTLSGADYDSALLCDVIEHTSDDVGLLRIARNTVRSGGVVLVTVPAHQFLWTVIDDASGHKRRYTRREVETAMTSAGLVDVQARYFNQILLPLHMVRMLKLMGVKDEQTVSDIALTLPPPWANTLLGWTMRAEMILPRWIIGSSIIATGKVP